MNSEQSGRSMVEILGVLAVLAVLTGAVAFGLVKAFHAYRLGALKDQTTALITNVRTAYSKYPTYAGLDNKLALESGIVPKNMAVGTRENIIENSFSGNVYIDTRPSLKKVKDGAFRITNEGLSAEACVMLATANFDEHLIKIEFGDAEYVGTVFPLDVQTAWEGCNCTDNTCIISLTYF